MTATQVKKIKTYLLVLLGTFFLNIEIVAQSLPQNISDSLQKIIDYSRTHTKDLNNNVVVSPGLIVRIHKPGEFTWSGASGKAWQSPDTVATPDLRFRVGSVSKTFLSAVVMQLIDSGYVNLNDSIGKYLRPSLVDSIPHGDSITIHQLLNHTSGMGLYTANSAFQTAYYSNTNRKWKPEELIDYGVKQGTSFLPGKGWEYCNTGYVVLGMIIEKVKGKPYDDVFKEMIIDRLGLKNTFYPVGKYVQGNSMSSTRLDGSVFYGCGEIISNNDDLITFHEAFRNKTIFSSALYDSVTKFIITTNGPTWKYGLGYTNLNYPGLKFQGHGGNVPGSSSGCYFETINCSQIYISYNYNYSNVNGYDLFRSISDYLCAVLPFISVNENEQLAEEINVYPNPSNGEFTLEIKNSTSESVNFQLVDILGKIVIEQTLNGSNGNIQSNFQLSDLKNGIYIAKIYSSNKIITKRIIIN